MGAARAYTRARRLSSTLGDSLSEDELFIVHWTHVPKAGGSAFAELARKVACVKNPAIRELNPCCIPKFCAAEKACYSLSSCPLLTGIGRHVSNMDRLRQIACCGAGCF